LKMQNPPAKEKISENSRLVERFILHARAHKLATFIWINHNDMVSLLSLQKCTSY